MDVEYCDEQGGHAVGFGVRYGTDAAGCRLVRRFSLRLVRIQVQLVLLQFVDELEVHRRNDVVVRESPCLQSSE